MKPTSLRARAARAQARASRRRRAVHQGRMVDRRARCDERFGDQVVWRTVGEGFTWETQDRARDVGAAEVAWG